MESEHLKYVFVVGNSRSGTTLMGRIIGNHSDVFTFHELHFFEQLWSEKDLGKTLSMEEARNLFARLINIQRSGYLSDISYKSFLNECTESLISNGISLLTREKVFEHFLFHEAKINGKKIPCDQTPRNLLYVEEILQIFPSAKIIAMIRDPRDVVLSQKKKWQRRFLGAKNIPLKESVRSWFNYHPVTIAFLWRQNCRAISALSSHPSVHLVLFEQLIEDSEVIVKDLCTFLQLPFEESMLDVEFIGSSHSKDQKVKGIVNNTGNWRNGGLKSSELYICQYICNTEMTQLGYEPIQIRKNHIMIIISLMSLPFKLFFSFVMNMNRIRNLKESIQKRLQLFK